MVDTTQLQKFWSGLPNCSVVVFRHLQKTGGTSIVQTFEALQQDLRWSVSGYWNSCWRSRSPIMAISRLRWLRGLRLALTRDGAAALNVPGVLDHTPWRPRAFLHVHHPDATHCGGLRALQEEIERVRPLAVPAGCHIVVAMVVRRPWDFYVSWFLYNGASRCGRCQFGDFVLANPNAQSHLVLGLYPRRYSRSLLAMHRSRATELKRQLKATLRGVDLLGTTDNLAAFARALCAHAGLRFCPSLRRVNAQDPKLARRVLRMVSLRAGTTEAEEAPNRSCAVHTRAVEEGAWLDRWLYAYAKRAQWTAPRKGTVELPASHTTESGCFEFGESSAPSNPAGGGGRPESVGLRLRHLAGEDVPSGQQPKSEVGVVADACSRCSALAGGLTGGANVAAVRGCSANTTSRAIFALCSTRVLLRGVARSCPANRIDWSSIK
jgi:hypothetical protein